MTTRDTLRRMADSALIPVRRARARLTRAPRTEADAPEAVETPAEVAASPPVVLVHGLTVPRQIMMPLGRRLSSRYERRVHYPRFNTRRLDLPECALHVTEQIRAWKLGQFDVVAHSMGGVILRWAVNHCGLEGLRRAVLIGPPSTGSWLADKLWERWGRGYTMVFGQSGLQLRRPPRGLTDHCGLLPDAEVGVIAGGSGTPQGERNWFHYPGDTDGTVGVAETIMPGMKDFVLLNHSHTTILFSGQTAHMTNLFLEHGVFRPRVRSPQGDDPTED